MGLTGIGDVNTIKHETDFLKSVCAAIFGWWLVRTYDFDGATRIRRVYRNSTGNFMCRRIVGWCYLEASGVVTKGTYIKRWEPINFAAGDLFD